jgi:hypothetical protein
LKISAALFDEIKLVSPAFNPGCGVAALSQRTGTFGAVLDWDEATATSWKVAISSNRRRRMYAGFRSEVLCYGGAKKEARRWT